SATTANPSRFLSSAPPMASFFALTAIKILVAILRSPLYIIGLPSRCSQVVLPWLSSLLFWDSV
ncbi:hypothetical protein U1Q18_046440, partial [Sarracenia purpurea var. burkii]